MVINRDYYLNALIIRKHNSFKKIIVNGGFTKQHYNEQGILIINIYDFLLNKDSLKI